MIRAMGILAATATATSAAATAPVCPPIDLSRVGETAQTSLDAQHAAFLTQSYVAVEEMLVKSFVSEILEPRVPAPAN